MDYDGTIIDTDVTEGSNNTKGLDQVLIELGYSPCFHPTEYQKFSDQYSTIYNINRDQGLAYAITIFNGVCVSDILKVTDYAYTTTYKFYYWTEVAPPTGRPA